MELVKPPAVQMSESGDDDLEARIAREVEEALEREREVTGAYDRASDHVTDFYGNAHELLRIHYAAEHLALENFREYAAIDDAPDLGEVLVESLLGSAFRLLGGYDAIARGLTDGLFARSPQRLREHVAAAVQVADEGASVAQAQRSGCQQRSGHNRAMARADFASDAGADSLGRWGDAARSLAAERDEMRRLVEDLRRTGMGAEVETVVQEALGPIPELPAGNLIQRAAEAIEVELYVAYYRASGARLIDHAGASPGSSRRYISGGGWRDAVGERLSALRPELTDDAALARFLGLPVEMTSVRHDAEGRTTPGGPRS